MSKPPSVVEYYSKNQGNSCGYCKSSNSSCSHGIWVHSLTVQEYQSLIDRGWRRSGHYCYKPAMNETCCPSYTIKCDAIQFKLTRSQRKLLKRFNHYLITGEKMNGSSNHQDRNESTDILNLRSQSCAPQNVLERIEEDTNESQAMGNLKNETQPTQPSKGPETSTDSSSTQPSPLGHQVPRNPITIAPPKSKSESTKAKHLRIERRKQTLLSRGLTLDEVNSTMQASKLRRMTKEKTLEDFINITLPENAKHRLEVRLVRSWPPSTLFRKTCSVEWQVYRRYQMSVHKDPPTKCTVEQFKRFLCSSPLQIKLIKVKSDEFYRTARQEWALFAKYQTTIHGETEEDTDYSSYKTFLMDSPFVSLDFKDPQESEWPGYGSFHQQYWLDGRLIAVGVIDILPLCVSSVYFFYDPDYSCLSLGTLSSLREVAFTRSLHSKAPDLSSYYMGFYIHSCPKMRYKGNLRPSYLMCPEVYTWHDIHSATQLLDQNKYSRLNPDPEAKDENGHVDLDQIKVMTGEQAMLYGQFKQMYDHDEEHPMIQEYAQLVGQYCAYRLVLVQ